MARHRGHVTYRHSSDAGQGSRVTRINPVAEQLTGWSEGEAIGRTLEDVFSLRVACDETSIEFGRRHVVWEQMMAARNVPSNVAWTSPRWMISCASTTLASSRPHPLHRTSFDSFDIAP